MSGDLDSLAADAADVDLATAPPGPQQPPPVAGPSPALADATALVGIFRPLLEMGVKYLRGAPDESWSALPAPIASLMDRYGVSMGDVMSNPWAQFGMACLPLGMHAFNGWQADQVERQKDAPQVIAAAAEAPPAPVEPAAPVHAPMVLSRG